MVFKSQNLIRKCKYCENPPKINMTSGRHKGYYKTCGSKVCLTEQYKDHHVCILKGRLLKAVDYVCFCCNEKFISTHASNKRYCKECVPNKAWRGRARRYGIGKKEWDKMLDNQNGTCALCDRNPEVVDHCHKNGFIRGLLCGKCNLYVSILDNDPLWIKKAKLYIGVKYAIKERK